MTHEDAKARVVKEVSESIRDTPESNKVGNDLVNLVLQVIASSLDAYARLRKGEL